MSVVVIVVPECAYNHAMKSWKQEPKTMLIVAAALLLLLPLLAALQYRWLGRVSDGEREQLKWSLRTTARRFTQDFDHELTLAYTAFFPPSSTQGDDKPGDHAARYERWRATAQHPQLIKSVFLAQLDEDDQLRLHRLNPDTRQFSAEQWPEEMAGLHQKLEEHYRNISRVLSQSSRTQTRETAASIRELLRRPFPPIAEEIPALVISIQKPPVVRGNGEISLRLSSEVVIVMLNLNYIQQEMLPTLAKRYFEGDKEFNFNVVIVPRNDLRKTLYQFGAPLQSPVAAQDLTIADVTAGLFGIRFDEVRTLLRNRTPETEAQKTAATPGQATTPNTSNSATPPRTDQQANAGPINDDNRPWQMLIQHRAGSLDAAVASVRYRNLGISFGILTMLATSVALMMFSARRAQQLAGQQIEFVAGVSHELRTPLSVIRAAGENLADGVIKDSEQIKRYGRLIRDEGRRLTEMVEQVLEFAGTQSGRQQYDLHPASLTELIEHAIVSSQQQIAEGGFEIEKTLSPALPEVLADASALTRAVQNLLSNAMKYSGDSRWIGVKAQPATGGKGTVVQVIVEDHGRGISAEELGQIFEPFYRGKEVTAAQIHGNGLGLSLVKSIVEAHGGKISVKSVPGRGSTFTLSLPTTSGVPSPASGVVASEVSMNPQ